MAENFNKLPNFFIIGAPKCGTTSLAAWLGEHPQIYMSPIKEPFYFSEDINNRLIENWEAYVNLFELVNSNHIAVGEASTTYLFSKIAVPKIENAIPDSRYIVIIRNPIEMAYSLYEQQLRSGNETIKDFKKAWSLSPERRDGNEVPLGCKDPRLLDYMLWCKLGEKIQNLQKMVSPERILVLVLDDMKKNPRGEYLKVLEFLKISDDNRTYFPVHNKARTWRFEFLGKVIRAIKFFVFRAKYVEGVFPRRSLGVVRFLEKIATDNRSRPGLSVDFRADLTDFFEEDIQLLEKILGRDFSVWYK